jgi:hypothetical protein
MAEYAEPFLKWWSNSSSFVYIVLALFAYPPKTLRGDLGSFGIVMNELS